MVELGKRPPEWIKTENIRFFEIADGEVIELKGITDQQWALYEPLLNALSATRIQTESGGVEITPMPYEEVKRYFPQDASWRHIYDHRQRLNKALGTSRWSIDNRMQEPTKFTRAPWFLRGPDDGVKNEGQPRPQEETIYSRTLGDEKKRLALKQFDPLAFGTSLLHCCVSNLANPEAKKIFTTDLDQLMSRRLPEGLKLDDIKGDKTLQECFEELIREAVNSMQGKPHRNLSEKQEQIIPFWNELQEESGQNPIAVMLNHFKEGDSSRPSLKTQEARPPYRLRKKS